MKYKNIIFDVGDVLLEYRWKDMMMDHGMTEEQSLAFGGILFDHPLWNILDLGTMTNEQVIAEYGKAFPEHADDIAWFLRHGEQMVVYRQDVWEYVARLKEKGYQIYLLSNYSEDLFTKHTKNATFMQNIDGMVVSYQIHITKPDEKIYQYLLHKYDLKAEDCIFFDDRKDNTEAAKKQGIDAVTITSKELLINELEALLK